MKSDSRDRPQVSILMPVHNAAFTVEAAVYSALAQTWRDLELIFVDDRCDDRSVARVRQRFGNNPKLRIIASPGAGLVAALNSGIAAARGDYIARLDADDWAHPKRIELQARMLDADSSVGLVACRAQAFPHAALTDGMVQYLKWQDRCLDTDTIAHQIYVESPFVHSSVMLRANIVERVGAYREGPFPEDYELWLRMHAAGVRMQKLDRLLVWWRQSAQSLSRTDARYSREAFDRLRARYLSQDSRLHQDRPLVFWGAGRRTRKRCRYLLDEGFQVTAWIDVDERKIGNVVWGAPVRPPQWLNRPIHANRPFVLSYVSRHGAAERISAGLRQMGYRPGEDYLLVG